VGNNHAHATPTTTITNNNNNNNPLTAQKTESLRARLAAALESSKKISHDDNYGHATGHGNNTNSSSRR
jgi:hypothetical protein